MTPHKKEALKPAGAGLLVLPVLLGGCVTKKDMVSIDFESDWNKSESLSFHNEGEQIFLAGIEQRFPKEENISIELNGKGIASASELADFLMMNNPQVPSSMALKISHLYVQESAIEGINSDMAFLQMCLETGFLKFDGTVTADQNNFCGLGTVNQNTKGHYFNTEQEGIRAHIQHIKAYSSTQPTNMPLIDPRFSLIERGTAENIHDLTGKWAIDPTYGEYIEVLAERLDDFIKAGRTNGEIII